MDRSRTASAPLQVNGRRLLQVDNSAIQLQIDTLVTATSDVAADVLDVQNDQARQDGGLDLVNGGLATLRKDLDLDQARQDDAHDSLAADVAAIDLAAYIPHTEKQDFRVGILRADEITPEFQGTPGEYSLRDVVEYAVSIVPHPTTVSLERINEHIFNKDITVDGDLLPPASLNNLRVGAPTLEWNEGHFQNLYARNLYSSGGGGQPRRVLLEGDVVDPVMPLWVTDAQSAVPARRRRSGGAAGNTGADWATRDLRVRVPADAPPANLDITTSDSITPTSDSTYNLGQAGKRWLFAYVDTARCSDGLEIGTTTNFGRLAFNATEQNLTINMPLQTLQIGTLAAHATLTYDPQLASVQSDAELRVPILVASTGAYIGSLETPLLNVTGTMSLNGNCITQVGAPSSGTDVVNKSYVDAAISAALGS
eukprot:jgi/Tetstr1/423531/TSEL_014204.t1